MIIIILIIIIIIIKNNSCSVVDWQCKIDGLSQLI